MGRKCTVFGCWGGYEGHKCTVFGFPKDPVEKRKWFVVIPNENLTFEEITVQLGVCQYHWPPDAPKEKKNRFEIPCVPPSVWTQKDNPHQLIEIPESCWRNREEKIRLSKNSQGLRQLGIDETSVFHDADLFKNSKDFHNDFERRLTEYVTSKSTSTVAWSTDRTRCVVVSDSRRGSIHDFIIYLRLYAECSEVTYEGYKGLNREKHGDPVPDFVLKRWSQFENILQFFHRAESNSGKSVKNLCIFF